MPISYTTIPKPSTPTYTSLPVVSAPSYTEVSEISDRILDEASFAILDESGDYIRSEQKPTIFTTVVTPA